MISKSVKTIQSLCTLLAMVSLPVLANNASGFLTISGTKINLSHAFVRLVPDPFNAGLQQLNIKIVNHEIKTGDDVVPDDEKTYYLELSVGSDQFLRSLTIIDPLLSLGNISGVGIANLEIDSFEPSKLSGKVATDGVFQAGSDLIEIDVIFSVKPGKQWKPVKEGRSQDPVILDSSAQLQDEGEMDFRIYEAVMAGDSGEVKRLLDAGADPDSRFSNRSLLAWASQNGFGAVVEVLLAHKADSNARDWLGHTALARAIEAEQVEIVKLLLKSGLDLSRQEPKNSSLGLMAVESLNLKIIELMLEAGLDFDKATPTGQTAVMFVVQGQYQCKKQSGIFGNGYRDQRRS